MTGELAIGESRRETNFALRRSALKLLFRKRAKHPRAPKPLARNVRLFRDNRDGAVFILTKRDAAFSGVVDTPAGSFKISTNFDIRGGRLETSVFDVDFDSDAIPRKETYTKGSGVV